MPFRKWYLLSSACALLLAGAGSVRAQDMAAAAKGYLAPAEAPDLLKIVPPAPAAGDPRDTADREIFKSTRSAENSPRWTLAQHDADYSVKGLLAAFACALGETPDAKTAPRLTTLLNRATADSVASSGGLKIQYKRKRPFLVDDGPICVAREASLLNSYDYPSGHSTLGWVTGLILAELEPDHSTAILARARAYGESRIFCGVHNASAVEAGRIVAASVVAALHGVPAFRDDMQAAAKELAALRKTPEAASPACAVESRGVAESPYRVQPH